MKGQRVGYVRVSTFDQNPERQLENIQVDRKFIDTASGKDVKRPQLEAMLVYVREGDTVVVHSRTVLLETWMIFEGLFKCLQNAESVLNSLKRTYPFRGKTPLWQFYYFR